MSDNNENKELDEILNEVKNRNTNEYDDSSSSENRIDLSESESNENMETEQADAQKNIFNFSSKENIDSEEYDDTQEDEPKVNDKNKKIIITVVAVIAAIAVAVGAYFGVKASKKEKPQEAQLSVSQTEPVTEKKIVNPINGEAGFNANAVGKRPVACVVENSSAARPQWGITSPDMIVEGEVEGGETRMLWFFADYSSLPKQIGPMRSARPSYVEFSQFFDSIFIHWGGSHSKDGYVGGYETIENKKVDHIDGISGGKLFGRDKSRKGAVEHTGVLYGSKLADTIESKDLRTEIKDDKFSYFSFNETEQTVVETPCNKISIKISSNCRETKVLNYDAEEKVYVNTESYKTKVSFKNVIVINVPTKYITTSYKGGKETYVNYDYSDGGTGKYASNGTVTDIKWAKKDGKLVLTDANGNELKLNAGDIYFALASSNYNSSITVE